MDRRKSSHAPTGAEEFASAGYNRVPAAFAGGNTCHGVSLYLTILIVSAPFNNTNCRGQSEGSLQNLQKISSDKNTYTMITGGAIRYAIRQNMASQGGRMWRNLDTNRNENNPAGYTYGDNKSPSPAFASPPTPENYDDEIFGYMVAPKGRGEALKASSVVEVSNAISTTPYMGEVKMSQGLKAAEPLLNPFSTENHFTRYAFTVTIGIPSVKRSTLILLLKSLRSLPVGGNHAANASEMLAENILYCLHKIPGRAALSIGLNENFSCEEKVDLSEVKQRAEAYGLHEGGIHEGFAGAGLHYAALLALPYCKKD